MMNSFKEKKLEEYYQICGKNPTKARKILEELDYMNDPYLLTCIALTYRDEGLFFKNGNRRKNILLDKLIVSKKFINIAFKLNPNCRDLLYAKGTIHDKFEEKFEAIDCYIKILEMGESLDINSNCSDSDLPYVQAILNDSRFQLYRLFYDIQSFEISKKFLKEYKKHLKKGVQTIYTPIEKFLKS